jgi:uncharacterized protein
MELAVIAVVALGGAFLSFFSGFGLGTLLLPAFLLLFPPPLAIAAAAVVHMLNNIFKLWLVGKYANWKIIRTFGLLSIVGALAGAWWMGALAGSGEWFHYSLFSRTIQVKGISLIIGVLIVVFAVLESWRTFQQLTISPKWLPVGGLISGFFGGLSGHQGALRSAFLMKSGLGRDAFIGSRVVIACMVDMTRIPVYLSQMKSGWAETDLLPIMIATLAAFTGAWLGNRYMKKVEMNFISRLVTYSLMLFGIAMAMGLV